MPNLRYIAGRAKEYREAKKLREQGFLVIRSAGSHSPIDLIAIMEPPCMSLEAQNLFGGLIRLIQVKGGKSGKREAVKALKEIRRYAGTYEVKVEAIG